MSLRVKEFKNLRVGERRDRAQEHKSTRGVAAPPCGADCRAQEQQSTSAQGHKSEDGDEFRTDTGCRMQEHKGTRTQVRAAEQRWLVARGSFPPVTSHQPLSTIRYSLISHLSSLCSILYSLFSIRYSLFAICCLLFTASVFASTLSTNFAEVFVDNLKIGGAYNLTEVANFPMWIGYRGDAPTDLKIDIVTPSSTELKSGYEPIPDTSWITVSKNIISLLPDESANLDVTINIPNDEKYLGKKYQAYVHVVTVPSKDAKGIAISLALKGRVIFGIAKTPPTEAELRELKKKKMMASQGVIITPEKFEVSVASFEKRINVTEDVPLKIINSSRENVAIFVEIVEPDASGVSLPRNYKKGGLSDIVLSRKKFNLKPDGIVNVAIALNPLEKEVIKDEKIRLFYVVRLNIKSPTIEIVRFVKIYIN